jgi:hypothetical protein
MSLKEKAKTFYELGKEWMETKLVDDRNNEKWILVSVAQQEIDKLKTFRDNAYKKWCESQAELERERGLLKQKLRQTCDEIRSKLKFLDYEQYHGDLAQSLNPTLKEINQLLMELLK